MKFGVVQFPGSCDDRDALERLRRGGEAVLLWHARRATCSGVDAVVVPGGFSYGDYLRVGAIARFSPVMEAVIAFAGDGGLVLGICNGFQVLLRGGPAARARCCRTRSCASSAARSTSRSSNARHAVHARAAPRASGCRSRSSTRPAATTRRRRSTLDARQVVLRYAPGHNPNGSLGRHRRREQRRGQRLRADAAPRARGRPAHRLRRRAAAFESMAPRHGRARSASSHA